MYIYLNILRPLFGAVKCNHLAAVRQGLAEVTQASRDCIAIAFAHNGRCDRLLRRVRHKEVEFF